jgi:hypothetical protein
MRVLRFLLFTFLFPAFGYSCTCLELTFEEQWETATSVFRGKVTQIDPADEGNSRIEMTFMKNWKGPAHKTTAVFSGENSAMCGYPFEPNQEYLVFATG